MLEGTQDAKTSLELEVIRNYNLRVIVNGPEIILVRCDHGRCSFILAAVVTVRTLRSIISQQYYSPSNHSLQIIPTNENECPNNSKE